MADEKEYYDSTEFDQQFNDLNFPLQFTFKVMTLSNDFIVEDSTGRQISYVRQKMLKLKENVEVFENDTRMKKLFNIRADRWLDFNSNYAFYDAQGKKFGSVARKGVRSIWKASYSIIDENGKIQFTIEEENPWAKVGDSLIGDLPIISMFTGYLFHPKYVVRNSSGTPVYRLSKESSFFGRRFRLEEIIEEEPHEQHLIMLSTMMMVLLERERG